MSKKYDDFIAAMIALCDEHQVTIDLGYDGAEVSDRAGVDYPDLAFWQNVRPRDGTAPDDPAQK